MTSLAAADALAWDSVEDLLGPASQRFFGSGYRFTSPTVREVRIHHEEASSSLEAVAGLRIGDLWSLKAGRAQRPHLGTTDVVALVGEAVGALIASRYSPATAAESRLLALSIAAAGAPLEDSLDAFPLRAELRDRPGETELAFEATVGPLRAEGRVLRPVAVPSMADVETPGPPLGLWGEGHVYGDLYRRRVVTLPDVRLEPGGGVSSGFVVSQEPSEVPSRGLEASDQPAVSLIEAFVAALQLGQVLLYREDRVPRGASETLWMRRTEVLSRRPLPLGAPARLTASLENSRIVRMGDRSWRCADVHASLDDAVAVLCSVAHALPD